MRDQPSTEPEPLIDVEQLVDNLRERVERERAAGRYTDDLGSLELESVRGETPQTEASGASAAVDARQVVYRPEVGYSSRPIIGPFLTAVKRLFYRVFFYPLDDLARQTDDAVRRLSARTGDLEAESAARHGTIQALRDRIDTLIDQLELSHRLMAEDVGRDVQRIAGDVQSLAVRLVEVEAGQERLQLASRLARLERLTRTSAQPATRPDYPASRGEPAYQPPSFDYMTFENRFRPEQTVRERHSAYLKVLDGCQRVVDLGCGRGELLELLRDAGVSAYGVELDQDVVAVCQEKGLEILQGDAVSHVEQLEAGAVDGIVASHLIEHLSPDRLWGLIAASAEKLAERGILVLETPNPESLLAGSINFHRDPTHVRPVHPDTLSFLCESAGFSDVEIQRLAPVPTDFRLPARSPDESPLARQVGKVVDQLNELIYGYQDYALIARL